MAARFDYPTEGWSTGTMRKAKRPQLAMDIRRGRPELEEPGIAEAEKLAGASKALSARGGITPVGRVEQATGATPMDVINAHHDQLTQAVNAHAQGNMTMADLKKLFKNLGWQADMSGTSIQAMDPNGETHQFGAEAQAR